MSKTRSSRIIARRATDYATEKPIWLMQWNHSHRYTHRFGEAICYSFRSIVTRPGRFGLFLDRPYYCYAGQHRYRKLSTRLMLHIAICVARGHLYARIFRLRERAMFALWSGMRAIASIPERLRNRKAMRDFERLIGQR